MAHFSGKSSACFVVIFRSPKEASAARRVVHRKNIEGPAPSDTLRPGGLAQGSRTWSSPPGP
eukprot:7043584-Alexandrium_andersonii.AAC.1